MSERLTGSRREWAKRDLLEQLAKGPKYTGELQGTRRFHGHHTLSHYQIRTLLRETGRVKEDIVQWGIMSSTLWILKGELGAPTFEQTLGPITKG